MAIKGFHRREFLLRWGAFARGAKTPVRTAVSERFVLLRSEPATARGLDEVKEPQRDRDKVTSSQQPSALQERSSWVTLTGMGGVQYDETFDQRS